MQTSLENRAKVSRSRKLVTRKCVDSERSWSGHHHMTPTSAHLIATGPRRDPTRLKWAYYIYQMEATIVGTLSAWQRKEPHQTGMLFMNNCGCDQCITVLMPVWPLCKRVKSVLFQLFHIVCSLSLIVSRLSLRWPQCPVSLCRLAKAVTHNVQTSKFKLFKLYHVWWCVVSEKLNH